MLHCVNAGGADGLWHRRRDAAVPTTARVERRSDLIAVNAVSQTGSALTGTTLPIPFEFGSTVLAGSSLALIDQIAAASKRGAADVVLVARDTETWIAAKRDALIDQRIAAVTAALANRGIAAGAISVTWRQDASDNAIYRDGPCLQEIAKLRIGSAASEVAPVIDEPRR